MKALRSVKISLANIRYFYRVAGIHRMSSLATALEVYERSETWAAWLQRFASSRESAPTPGLVSRKSSAIVDSRSSLAKRCNFVDPRTASPVAMAKACAFSFRILAHKRRHISGIHPLLFGHNLRIVNERGGRRGLEQLPGGQHPLIDRSADGKHGLVHHLAQTELHRDTA